MRSARSARGLAVALLLVVAGAACLIASPADQFDEIAARPGLLVAAEHVLLATPATAPNSADRAGILVITDLRVLFLKWNGKERRYDPKLAAPWDRIRCVQEGVGALALGFDGGPPVVLFANREPLAPDVEKARSAFALIEPHVVPDPARCYWVEAAAGPYAHAASGLVLPASLRDSPRRAIWRDDTYRGIAASYDSAEGRIELSIEPRTQRNLAARLASRVAAERGGHLEYGSLRTRAVRVSIAGTEIEARTARLRSSLAKRGTDRDAGFLQLFLVAANWRDWIVTARVEGDDRHNEADLRAVHAAFESLEISPPATRSP